MTQVLCRLDHENKPVVFIADTLNNGRIKAWQEGDERPKAVGVDYYQATQPLSESDAQTLAKRYAKAMKDETVIVRQRLPRVYRTRPDILQAEGNPSPVTVKQPTIKRGKKSNARSEAARRQVQAEIAKTNGVNIPDEALNELALKIATILKDSM